MNSFFSLPQTHTDTGSGAQAPTGITTTNRNHLNKLTAQSNGKLMMTHEASSFCNNKNTTTTNNNNNQNKHLADYYFSKQSEGKKLLECATTPPVSDINTNTNITNSDDYCHSTGYGYLKREMDDIDESGQSVGGGGEYGEVKDGMELFHEFNDQELEQELHELEELKKLQTCTVTAAVTNPNNNSCNSNIDIEEHFIPQLPSQPAPLSPQHCIVNSSPITSPFTTCSSPSSIASIHKKKSIDLIINLTETHVATATTINTISANSISGGGNVNPFKMIKGGLSTFTSPSTTIHASTTNATRSVSFASTRQVVYNTTNSHPVPVGFTDEPEPSSVGNFQTKQSHSHSQSSSLFQKTSNSGLHQQHVCVYNINQNQKKSEEACVQNCDQEEENEEKIIVEEQDVMATTTFVPGLADYVNLDADTLANLKYIPTMKVI